MQSTYVGSFSTTVIASQKGTMARIFLSKCQLALIERLCVSSYANSYRVSLSLKKLEEQGRIQELSS